MQKNSKDAKPRAALKRLAQPGFKIQDIASRKKFFFKVLYKINITVF